MSDTQRPFDIVLFGATGFTGGLTADYLARYAPVGTHWAIAGRSERKLDGLRSRLASANLPCPPEAIVVADVANDASLAAMAASARVLITTVGPYGDFGEPVVRACVEQGTDYVDLSGEQDFVEDMRDRYGQAARERGVRIVSCCGFDSIPHDLGAYFTRKLLPSDVPVRMNAYVWTNGSISGGTLRSAVRTMARMKDIRKRHAERRALAADKIPTRKVGKIRESIHFEPEVNGWVVPMPTIDPDIVLQSAAQLEVYGPDFRYGHYMKVGSLARTVGLVTGVGAVFLMAQTAPTRALLLSTKDSGEGPSPERRARSRFRVTFVATSGDQRAVGEVSGGDPGYDETSKMLSESALSLAFDGERLPKSAGVITPAVAFGDRLVERLNARGLTFRVVESPAEVRTA